MPKQAKFIPQYHPWETFSDKDPMPFARKVSTGCPMLPAKHPTQRATRKTKRAPEPVRVRFPDTIQRDEDRREQSTKVEFLRTA
jgi:hypothetical protein